MLLSLNFFWRLIFPRLKSQYFESQETITFSKCISFEIIIILYLFWSLILFGGGEVLTSIFKNTAMQII